MKLQQQFNLGNKYWVYIIFIIIFATPSSAQRLTSGYALRTESWWAPGITGMAGINSLVFVLGKHIACSIKAPLPPQINILNQDLVFLSPVHYHTTSKHFLCKEEADKEEEMWKHSNSNNCSNKKHLVFRWLITETINLE